MAEVSDARVQPHASAAALELGALRNKKPRSLWSDAFRQFRKHKLAVGGVCVLAFLVLATLIGPMIWPKSRTAIDFASASQGMSMAHPMGTDDMGHDIFARILWGGRISLAVGVVAMLLSIMLGTLIGAVAGFFGGFLDSALMRLTDMFISLPSLPLLLLVIYLFRDTLRNSIGPNLGPFILIVALIGITTWMPVARLVRASFLSIKEKEYIEAARAIGQPDVRIMTRHILPNAWAPIIVQATLSIGQAIIYAAGLSFIGLGTQPPGADWGVMLKSGHEFLRDSPWMGVFPGLAILITVLGVNLLGDGLDAGW
jgi:peptide/nickel transport system permease protein